MHFFCYVIRAYFKNPLSNVASNVSAAPSQDLYYVAEKTLQVAFTNDVQTGLCEVAGVREVAGVTYYNLAGVASAQPHDGANIVVTRYTDGTTSTKKLMR